MATGVSKTHFFEAIVENMLKGTNPTAIAGLYLGLFTAAPGESGGGTEVTGGAYARQALAFGAVAAQASGSQIANAGAIVFPTATAGWGTVTHVAIFDAASGGNMLYYGTLTVSLTVSASGQVQFAIGAITLLED